MSLYFAQMGYFTPVCASYDAIIRANEHFYPICASYDTVLEGFPMPEIIARAAEQAVFQQILGSRILAKTAQYCCLEGLVRLQF